jgi:hypothetical protein
MVIREASPMITGDRDFTTATKILGLTLASE